MIDEKTVEHIEADEDSYEWKMELLKMKDKKIGSDAVNAITSGCNGGSCKEIAQGMVEALLKEHRTLQQDFWRAVLLTAREYAKFNHDLRNQDAVEMCKKITELNIGLGCY